MSQSISGRNKSNSNNNNICEKSGFRLIPEPSIGYSHQLARWIHKHLAKLKGFLTNAFGFICVLPKWRWEKEWPLRRRQLLPPLPFPFPYSQPHRANKLLIYFVNRKSEIWLYLFIKAFIFFFVLHARYVFAELALFGLRRLRRCMIYFYLYIYVI